MNYRTLVNCCRSRHVSRRMRRALAEVRDSEAAETPAQDVDGDGMTERESEPHRGNGGLRGEDMDFPDDGVVTLEEQPYEEHAFGPAATLVAEWRELRAEVESAGSRVERVQAGVRRWEMETAMLRDFGLTLPPETQPLDHTRREDHLRWRLEALAEARRELRKARCVRLLRKVLTLGVVVEVAALDTGSAAACRRGSENQLQMDDIGSDDQRSPSPSHFTPEGRPGTPTQPRHRSQGDGRGRGCRRRRASVVPCYRYLPSPSRQ